MTPELLSTLVKDYGDSFYLLNLETFVQNYTSFKSAFTKHYTNFNISYSYKTNYIPAVCKIVDDLGGYAEVVSSMEMDLALRIGVNPKKIIFNGPYKKREDIERLLFQGGQVNIDSLSEAELICKIAQDNEEQMLHVAIRVNFDIGEEKISRFGIDINSKDFSRALFMLRQEANIEVVGLHCHFASRGLDLWPARVEGVLELLDRWFIHSRVSYISLGGGIYGHMKESLAKQFQTPIPSYDEYANIIGPAFATYYKRIPEANRPTIFLEPGSALAGDIMDFYCTVVSIKEIQGKAIATLSGSIYNINPTLNTKNPPIGVYTLSDHVEEYLTLDFGGYTCIERDYLYKGYQGKLGVGDMVRFENVGSYSVVLKPPFILPNVPILIVNQDTKDVQTVKRAETFDDVFNTYVM